jgi:flagellar biogenesis protein FliO
MAFLIFVAAMAIIAGLVWVMMRMERSHRERIERQREVWRAEGSVGPEPGKWGGGNGV